MEEGEERMHTKKGKGKLGLGYICIRIRRMYWLYFFCFAPMPWDRSVRPSHQTQTPKLKKVLILILVDCQRCQNLQDANEQTGETSFYANTWFNSWVSDEKLFFINGGFFFKVNRFWWKKSDSLGDFWGFLGQGGREVVEVVVGEGVRLSSFSFGPVLITRHVPLRLIQCPLCLQGPNPT